MPEVRTVSVVVPCYNEEAVIGEFYRRAAAVADALAAEGVSTEMILVDDSSRDETPGMLAALAMRDPRVKVLRLARNRGHQIACTAGLDFAGGDAVIIIDADLQDPPELIPQMVELIRQGYDVVHAQRERRPGESFFKLATAKMFYAGLKRLSKTEIIEDCGDFRAVSARAAEAARAFREPHRFLRGLFAQIGFKHCIFRFHRDERFAGETKYTLKKMVRLAGDALLSFSSTPVKAILWLAMSLWGLSLVYLAVVTPMLLVNPERFAKGWTSLVFLMTFFTGLILASISVIGAYVARIFEQNQQRPLYWLAETRNVSMDSPLPSGFESREVRLSRNILSRVVTEPRAKGGARAPAAGATPGVAEVKLPVFHADRAAGGGQVVIPGTRGAPTPAPAGEASPAGRESGIRRAPDAPGGASA
ncbi:MAG: glycosyltransferase family 2 protein [Phycisphaerales bacterium]